MTTYDACFRYAFWKMKLEALDKMSESLESWDTEKHPEFPKEYIKASAVYHALREIEKNSL